MSQFLLKIGQVLQGDFQIKDLNLLLVFQVNCPGCFVYALPLAAKLHQQYGDRLNILGLSTAFEDFALNTPQHTQMLLENGELVGMTQLYFQRQGQQTYPLPIPFPVAFDQLRAGSQSPPGVGQTFLDNHLPGTPSWILFDRSYTLHAQWLGHKSEAEVLALVAAISEFRTTMHP